jgi:uncharacterized protein (UPF0332 family)
LGEKEEFIKELLERIRKSDELFQVAKKLHADGFLEDSISRAYYSLYHLLITYLLLEGESPKTHKGLLNRIGLRIKEGKLPDKIGKLLRTLFQQRETADYEIFMFVSADEVTSLLKELDQVREELKKKYLNLEKLKKELNKEI